MPKTISIKLDAKSIDKAIKQVNDYKNGLRHKTDLLVRELARIGKETAMPAFISPAGENDPAVVYVELQGEAKAAVIADGESAVFVEFGAGVGVNEHPQANEFGFYPGSYSESVNGMYFQKGYWIYNGKRYDMITAGKGMWEASKAMRAAIEQTAKKVFGQ